MFYEYKLFYSFIVYFKARSEREHSIVLCVCVVFREVRCALRGCKAICSMHMPQNNVYDEIYCLNFANSMLSTMLFLTYNWVFIFENIYLPLNVRKGVPHRAIIIFMIFTYNCSQGFLSIYLWQYFNVVTALKWQNALIKNENYAF